MDWMKAEKPVDFGAEANASLKLFRHIAQRSYRHQRRVVGLSREDARALVTARQAAIYHALADRAARRLAVLLPSLLRKIRHAD